MNARRRTGGRRTQLRRVKPIVFVAVEGESERRYLEALREHRYNNDLVIRAINTQTRGRGRGSSIADLLTHLEEFERRPHDQYRRGESLWLVCDQDEGSNAAHAERLQYWLRAAHHRAAIQGNSLEGWFLAHFTDQHPRDAKAALKSLSQARFWPDYSKGQGVPSAVVARTDDACDRMKRFVENNPASGPWPPDGGSTMFELIEHLDSLVLKRS